MNYKPTAKGYFSGIGIFEIGLMESGIDFVQSLDIDKGATGSEMLGRSSR